MAEDFVTSELVLPGTYIRVLPEGLIGVRGISAGNIGIVGATDPELAGITYTLSSPAEAVERVVGKDTKPVFGPPLVDPATPRLNLTAQIGELFRNGARTVYARGVSDGTDPGLYGKAFEELVKEDVQLLVAPELGTDAAKNVLGPIVNNAESQGKDLIAVIGADAIDQAGILGAVEENDRLILAAPGYAIPGADPQNPLVLPGNYVAGPVAGLISSLSPQVSPTNKVIAGVSRLAQRFSYGEREALVKGRVLVLEDRSGVRVVRGVTMDTGGFTQITTRRIVDFAKAGIRQVSNPFVGRLNNVRVRAALQSAIDGFLTTMRVDEQLTDYRLEVMATRRDEIEGRAIVNVLLQPTFSIDFVAVTIVLQ